MTTQFNARLLNADPQVVPDFWCNFAQAQESAMQLQTQCF